MSGGAMRDEGLDGLDAEQARSIIRQIVETSDREPDNRALIVVRRYALGATLERVGLSLGVSRECARQLINTTEWPMSVLKAARAAIEQDERETTEQKAVKLVLQWSSDHPGEPLERAVRDLGMPMPFIASALGSRKALHVSQSAAPRRAKRWTNEELIDLLKKFHSETGSTVSQEFEDWSLPRGGPTRQTPINRFGKWYHALEAAGISSKSYTVERVRRHTENDLWAAIIEFFTKERDSYSFNSFGEWLSTAPELPSGSLIRVRLGLTWAEISRTAHLVVSGGVAGLDPNWVKDVSTPRDWQSLVPKKEDPVKVLKRAIPDIGPVITMAKYSRWAAEHEEPPANTLIQRAAMPWSELVAKAGGRVGLRGRRGKISDEELLEPLIAFLDEGNEPGYERYLAWARKNRRTVASTIAKRFGGWSRAVDAATEARRHKEQPVHGDTGAEDPKERPAAGI